MVFEDGALVSFGILAGFLVQTVTGFAGGLVSLPILLFALPVAPAVALISIFNLTFSVLQIAKQRENIDFEIYRDLGIVTILGVVIGSTVLSYGNPEFLKKGLGVFVLLYVGYRFLNTGKISISRWKAWLLGSVGGFFAGLFASGAPPFVVYMTSKYEEPKLIRANIIGILTITNIIRAATLIATGVLSTEVWRLSLWGIPSFLFALILGERIFGGMSKVLFLRVVLGFLTLSGVLLIVR